VILLSQFSSFEKSSAKQNHLRLTSSETHIVLFVTFYVHFGIFSNAVACYYQIFLMSLSTVSTENLS
jgi:hypothetical protein